MKAALDSFRLDGKIALVSGGTGIVGKPIVQALCEAGATVVVASRNVDRCRAFAASLEPLGLHAEGERLDLSSESEIRDLRDRILKRHGRIDVLFNNAVARAGGDLRHETAQQWEHTMRVNSTGVFLASQIFSEPMQAQRSGSIINISSIYGVVGPNFSIYEGTVMSNPVDYSFAKSGIIGLTRYLASFLGSVRRPCQLHLAGRVLDGGHASRFLNAITRGERFSGAWLPPTTLKAQHCSWPRMHPHTSPVKISPWTGVGRQSRRPRRSGCVLLLAWS